MKKLLLKILVNVFNFKRIKDFITFYATLLAILSISIVSGIIEVKPQLNVLILDPVIYLDINGFKAYYDSMTKKKLPEYINKALVDYSCGRNYIDFGLPDLRHAKDFQKVRIVNDGEELFFIASHRSVEAYKYELGWVPQSQYWFKTAPDTGLKTIEDRRIGVSYFIRLNALFIPFVGVFGGELRKSAVLEDPIKKVFDAIEDNKQNKQNYELYEAILHNRKVYNIISLENQSAQKINNITLQLKTSYVGENEVVAWTHSTEIVEKDTSTKYLTKFRIPYLRPRTSIEFIVRSRYLYKTNDIYLEWDRLKNLNIKTMKLLLIILLFITLLVQIVGHIVPKKLINKKKNKLLSN